MTFFGGGRHSDTETYGRGFSSDRDDSVATDGAFGDARSSAAARQSAPARTQTRRWLRELRHAVSWHRRLLAAGLLAGAVACALGVLRPAPPATTAVIVAAREVSAGATLVPADLRVVRVPLSLVPAGAVSDADTAVGRVVTAPIGPGEPMTHSRFLGPGLLAGLDEGLVGAPVRVADPGAAALLRPGDLVDVLAAAVTSDAYAEARVLASGVRVVTVPRAESDDGGLLTETSTGEGALVLLATTRTQAADLAAAAVSARLTVTLRPG
jgi:pilus assembly protein CpaB